MNELKKNIRKYEVIHFQILLVIIHVWPFNLPVIKENLKGSVFVWVFLCVVNFKKYIFD